MSFQGKDPLVVHISNREVVELVRSPQAIAENARKLEARLCALASTCPQCDTPMEPEHAHYRCPKCHYRDSCCF